MNPNRQSTTVPTEGWFRFLGDRGLRPVLVSREMGDFHRWARSQGIPAYCDPLPVPDKLRPWRFARSLWKLRSLVKTHKIDLIHCNEHDIYPIGQYLASVCRLPLVVSVHFKMGRGYCEWAFGRGRAPAKMFFVSGRNLAECASDLEGIVEERRWKVLHNGLDLNHYQASIELRKEYRSSYGISDQTVVLGVACAFRPRKQIEHFLEAASNLESQDIHVLIAGFSVPGKETYAKELLQSAQEKLKDQFTYVGELSDLRPFCNALDVFVNTSREESFGIAALEAMACGCPVVGYDSKAVDEVVLPDGGEITTQDDVRALTEALQAWIHDPVRLSAARKLARQQSERFDLRVISDQLWDEYNEVLESRKQDAEEMATTR